MKNIICIIPARGGSKRIPRKNIKHFLGKPIIGYAIQKALEVNIFDDVIISTDDLERQGYYHQLLQGYYQWHLPKN